MRLSMWQLRLKETSSAGLIGLIISTLAFAAGCSTVPEGVGGSGKFDTPPAPEKGFYATCTTETRGGHKGPWTGPLRAAKADAVKDAKDHESDNSGHVCTVVDY